MVHMAGEPERPKRCPAVLEPAGSIRGPTDRRVTFLELFAVMAAYVAIR